MPPILKFLLYRFCSAPVQMLLTRMELDPEGFQHSKVSMSRNDSLYGFTWPERVLLRAVDYRLKRAWWFTKIYDVLLHEKKESWDE